MERRRFLLGAAAGGTLTALAATLGRPANAADPGRAAFQATTPEEAIRSIGASGAVPSKDIVLKLPDVAENGASVPIEVASRIPNTQSIAILADKNPLPLIASFEFPGGAEAYASTRVKLANSSPVRVFVKADGKVYTASREVRVTVGGCAV